MDLWLATTVWDSTAATICVCVCIRLQSQTDPGSDPGFPLTNCDWARCLLPLTLGFLICRLARVVPTSWSSCETEVRKYR